MKRAIYRWGIICLGLAIPVFFLRDAHGQGSASTQQVELPKVWQPAAESVVEDRGITLSSTGRFRVLGNSVQVRRMFSSQAEEVSLSYEKLMGREVSAALPIMVQLHESGKVSPVKPSVVEAFEEIAGQALRLVIHVRLDEGATPGAFRSSMVRCLLLADIVGGRRPGEIREGELVPAWLHAGVLTAMDLRDNPERSTVAAGVFARGRAFPVEKILATQDPDTLTSVTRAAYDTSACGLVLLLLQMENGSARFQRMLLDFASIEGEPTGVIRHHFQEMAESDKALEKWWALQVARMARPGATDYFTAEETVSRLSKAEMVEMEAPDEEGGGLVSRGFLQILAIPEKDKRLGMVRMLWLRHRSLTPRIHPFFRPLLDERLRVLQDAMEGKKESVEERWVVTEEEIKMLSEKLDGIDDYLNWWEITQGKGVQADLERYLKATRVRPAAARQENPIGDYLDAMEKVLRSR